MRQRRLKASNGNDLLEFQSNDFFRLLLDSLEEYAVYTTDKIGRIQTWNFGAEHLLGYKKHEVVGRKSNVFNIPADRREKINERKEKIALIKGRARDERWYVRKDGVRFWGVGTTYPLRDAAGNLIGFTKIIRDLTKRKLLEEEQRKSVSILESITDAFFAIDKNWNITYMNSQAEPLMRKPRAELIGQNLLAEFPDLIGTSFYKNYRKAMRQQESVHFTEYYSPFSAWFEVHVYPSSSGLAIYFTDVTDQRKVEEELLRSERKYKMLFQSMQQGAILQDSTGKIIEANPAAEKILGLSAYGVSKTHAISSKWRTIHEDGSDFPQSMHPSSVAMRTGKKVNGVVMGIFNPKLGEYKWVIVNSVPEFLPGSHMPHQVYTVFTDITDKKKAEQAIAESELNFRNLSETIPQLVWMSDPTGKTLYFNRQWYEYTKSTPEKSMGNGWSLCLHPDDIDRTLEKWHQCVKSGRLFEIEYRIKDGESDEFRWFLGRALPIKDSHGIIMRWFGTCTDIDDQKKIEQQKDDFIGIASHELKTPLTSVKGYIQILERVITSMNNERASYYVSKTMQYVDRLDKLVADLLDVSRIQKGKLQLAMDKFNLKEIIDASIETVAYSMNHHQVIIKGDPSAQLIGDKNRLEQVMVNLLINAAKYSPTSPEIEISVSKKMRNVEVSVIDHGIGIPKKSLPRIFDLFYRAHETEKQVTGLGIGLFLSNQIILRHGGIMSVKSTKGKGSTFTFSLPLLK